MLMLLAKLMSKVYILLIHLLVISVDYSSLQHYRQQNGARLPN
jgi:hypothetical protein